MATIASLCQSPPMGPKQSPSSSLKNQQQQQQNPHATRLAQLSLTPKSRVTRSDIASNHNHHFVQHQQHLAKVPTTPSQLRPPHYRSGRLASSVKKQQVDTVPSVFKSQPDANQSRLEQDYLTIDQPSTVRKVSTPVIQRLQNTRDHQHQQPDQMADAFLQTRLTTTPQTNYRQLRGNVGQKFPQFISAESDMRPSYYHSESPYYNKQSTNIKSNLYAQPDTSCQQQQQRIPQEPQHRHQINRARQSIACKYGNGFEAINQETEPQLCVRNGAQQQQQPQQVPSCAVRDQTERKDTRSSKLQQVNQNQLPHKSPLQSVVGTCDSSPKFAPRLPRGVSRIPHRVSRVTSPNSNNAKISQPDVGQQIMNLSAYVSADYDRPNLNEPYTPVSPAIRQYEACQTLKSELELQNESYKKDINANGRSNFLNETFYYSIDDRNETDASVRRRYLTFSKDQAASNFNSLQDELSSMANLANSSIHVGVPSTDDSNYRKLQRRSNEDDEKCQDKQLAEAESSSASNSRGQKRENPNDSAQLASERPANCKRAFDEKPIVSHYANFGGGVNGDGCYEKHQITANVYQQQQRQPPVCEAFIMTGQSMLKLTNDESDTVTSNGAKQQHYGKVNITEQALESVIVNGQSQMMARTTSGTIATELPVKSSVIAGTATSTNSHSQESVNSSMANSTETPAQPRASMVSSTLTSAAPMLNRELETDATAAIVATTTTITTGLAATKVDLSQVQYIGHSLEETNGSLCRINSNFELAEHSEVSENLQKIIAKDSCKSDINRCEIATADLPPPPPTTTEILDDSSVHSQMVHPLAEGLPIADSELENRKRQPDKVPAIDAKKLSHYIDDESLTTNQHKQSDVDSLVNNVPIEQSAMILINQDQNSQSAAVTGSPPLGPADRESAKRLAERLYNLNGFKKTDVCHHLAKNNPFGQLVAEEYLKHFEFRMMKLDAALRKFLSKFQLSGETQERERVFSHFSRHYYECNSEKFPNPEAVQTLVCALILLNTDIHSDKRGRFTPKKPKLSLVSFIEGLNSSIKEQQMLAKSSISCVHDAGDGNSRPLDTTDNTGFTFPRHMLVDLYESVKKRPFECGTNADNCDLTTFESELDKIYKQQVANGKASRSSTLPSRRYAPGSNTSSFTTMSPSSRRLFKRNLDRMKATSGEECLIQFKSGQVNRKRIYESNAKPTPKGRRSWRRTHFILQDLRLIMRFGSDMNIVTSKDGVCVGNKGANNAPADINEEKTIAETKEATDANSNSLDGQQEDQPKVSSSSTSSSPSKRRLSKILAQDLRNTIRIHHAFAKISTSYSKRQFVFHLKLANQSELLVQANDEPDLESWVQTINFASACLSSPALPSAISNSRSQPSCVQRPLLPTGYTKLSYWEQLLDHEERLKRLKIELDEHLAEASNTKNAKRKDQTEFIEKIAYLRHDIERYTTYIDLMRKRSNSPEAILLSKRSQNFN